MANSRGGATPRATGPIFVLRGVRTVARISHVPQIGSQPRSKQAVALIFAHPSGMVMVNVIVRGPGSKGHSPCPAGKRQRARHRSRIGRGCVRGFCSGGFSAVYALAHAGLRQGGWVRRIFALRGQASASVLLLALLLPGCAVGPDYAREPAPVPTTYKELKGWKRATPSDDLARGNWWAPFRDPRLDTLLREVEISNQTVAAACPAWDP